MIPVKRATLGRTLPEDCSPTPRADRARPTRHRALDSGATATRPAVEASAMPAPNLRPIDHYRAIGSLLQTSRASHLKPSTCSRSRPSTQCGTVSPTAFPAVRLVRFGGREPVAEGDGESDEHEAATPPSLERPSEPRCARSLEVRVLIFEFSSRGGRIRWTVFDNTVTVQTPVAGGRREVHGVALW
jgi:hypothetical protein